MGGTGQNNAGTLRWNGTNFQGYDGSDWNNLDEANVNLSAVDQDIVPDVTNTRKIGSDTHMWDETWTTTVRTNDIRAAAVAELYVGGNSASGIRLDGDGAGTGLVTVDGDLHVNGDITANGTISDGAFKDNIEEIDGALDTIAGINAVSFEWNALYEEHHGEDPGTKFGFVAQELQEIYPFAVRELKGKKYGDETYLGVDYEKLVPLLTAGIKELTSEVKDLKSRVRYLETKGATMR